jgi:hypothetical protein
MTWSAFPRESRLVIITSDTVSLYESSHRSVIRVAIDTASWYLVIQQCREARQRAACNIYAETWGT